MWMAFANSAGRDSNKSSSILQRRNILGATIPHSGTKSTDKLLHAFVEFAFVWYTTHNSFRNQFLDIVFHILEITVFGSFLHGFHRTHAAVGFEFSSFKNNGFAR